MLKQSNSESGLQKVGGREQTVVNRIADINQPVRIKLAVRQGMNGNFKDDSEIKPKLMTEVTDQIKSSQPRVRVPLSTNNNAINN